LWLLSLMAWCRFGAAAAAATHVMFWINLPLVLCCILYIPFAMVIKHEHGINTMTALWLLPVVPACVAANTAGVVSIHMTSAPHAIVVLYLGEVAS
jgi:tellurite resistance protein TehA-like permease